MMTTANQSVPADNPPPTPPPTIHEAELASGPSGAVIRGAAIELAAAVQRRKNGLEVVVCGENVDDNRRLAQAIESAVGSCKRGDPHRSAGAHALPHYQPHPRPPAGHTFYETPRRKARKS